MTDKEKTRKEVERLINELIQERGKYYSSDVDDACILELQNVLTYIDSLQEEPVSEDLEEEVHNFSLHYHGDIVTDEDGIHLCDINESKLLEIANHFINWQKEQMIKDAVDAQYRNIMGEVLLAFDPKKLGIKTHDKVKVLIIKDE